MTATTEELVPPKRILVNGRRIRLRWLQQIIWSFLAAIVAAEFAAALEGMTPGQARELLEDLADGAAAREALEEPGEDIPTEQVWAELGLT